MKALFETSERKVNQQTEHIDDFNRVHLKSEHRKSSSYLFDHSIVSIHLLRLDLIRFQRKTRFQTKEERRIVLHERHSDSSDSNYLKDFQKHRRSDFKHRVLFVFDTSATEHDHLRRVIAFDHQFDIFFHQESQSAIESISYSSSNAASTHALRLAKLFTKAENKICYSLQQRSWQIWAQSFLFDDFLIKIFDHNHRQLFKNRNNHSRSNHAKLQSFDYIHERHRYRQSDRDRDDDNYFFDIEHDSHNDEQKTNLFESHHEDHDLLWKNNETRSRSKRNWESSQRSFHRHLHELLSCYSSHLMLQETIRSIFVADINSKNKTMRSRNSHSLNFRSRRSLRQRSNQYSNQKITEWRESDRDLLILVTINSKVLISTIRNEIRIRAKIEWIETWKIIIIEKIIHQIIKKFIKNVLKKFKKMTRFESAVIVQIRTNKIELRDYLYKIKAIEFWRCSCEVKRQTMHHTLLKCSKFDDLRKKMWTNKRETNLLTLLNIFELIAKIFKYLFATSELLQFRHLNKAQASDDDVDSSKKTLMKNDW